MEEDNISIGMGETQIITFNDSYLLLGSTVHNTPLYVTLDFGRFQVTILLIEPYASINIMSLAIIVYLQINNFKIEGNHMVLKRFIESIEKALWPITIAFEIYGQTFVAKLPIVNTHTHIIQGFIRKTMDLQKWHSAIIFASMT